MKKYALFSILIAVIIFVLLLLNKQGAPPEMQSTSVYAAINSTSACFQDACFKITIADTQEARERGLMFVSELPEDEGMLFIFEESGIHPFWMKNTLIPLDMLWLNEDREVVFVKKNAEPCPSSGFCPSINPGIPAKYVLEINAGLADELT